MKKLTGILIALILTPLFTHAQDRDLKSLFNRYKNVKGFELKIEDPGVDIDFDGDFDFFRFLDKIENLYILNFDQDKGDPGDLESFSRKLDKLIEKKGFKSVLDISGEGTVKILTRKNNSDQTTDLLLITKGDDDAMYFWASGE